MTLDGLLAMVRQNESVGAAALYGVSPYQLTPQQNVDYPQSHASGAYQFEPATWQQLTQESGIGTGYAEAWLAPSDIQDAVAQFAATHYDPNSAFLWRASAPSGGYPAVDGASGGGGGGGGGAGLTITGTALDPATGLPDAASVDPATGQPYLFGGGTWQTLGGGGAPASTGQAGAASGGTATAPAASCSWLNPICWWQGLISWLTSIGADIVLAIIAIMVLAAVMLTGDRPAATIARTAVAA